MLDSLPLRLGSELAAHGHNVVLQNKNCPIRGKRQRAELCPSLQPSYRARVAPGSARCGTGGNQWQSNAREQVCTQEHLKMLVYFK